MLWEEKKICLLFGIHQELLGVKEVWAHAIDFETDRRIYA